MTSGIVCGWQHLANISLSERGIRKSEQTTSPKNWVIAFFFCGRDERHRAALD